MPADNPTCSTCRWWQEFREPDPTEEQEGYCRRHAPRPAFEALVPSDEGGGRRGYPQWPRLAHYEWCGEHAPRVEAPKGGKSIVDSEMRLYDLASFRACATERGVTLTGDPLPGDGFVIGSTSYIYAPEPPDAPR